MRIFANIGKNVFQFVFPTFISELPQSTHSKCVCLSHSWLVLTAVLFTWLWYSCLTRCPLSWEDIKSRFKSTKHASSIFQNTWICLTSDIWSCKREPHLYSPSAENWTWALCRASKSICAPSSNHIWSLFSECTFSKTTKSQSFKILILTFRCLSFEKWWSIKFHFRYFSTPVRWTRRNNCDDFCL